MTMAWRVFVGLVAPYYLWVGGEVGAHYWSIDLGVAIPLTIACAHTAFYLLHYAVTGKD